MSLLHRLPGELVHAVLQLWLELVDIAYLDSATCVKEERAAFLEVACAATMYDYSRDFEFYSDLPKTRRLARYFRREFQQWILLRGVRLSSLASYPKCERVLDEKITFRKVIEATGSCLKSFYTHMDLDMVMVALRKYCPVLERLECGKGGKRGSVGKLLSSCPLLQHLIMKHTDASSVESMKQYGAQLRSLRMSHELYLHAQEPDWASLVPYLPNLTSLEVGDGCSVDTVLNAVAKHCPHLRTLKLADLAVTGRYDLDAALIVIAKGCPHLERLQISESHYIKDITLLKVLRSCKKLVRLQLDRFDNESDAVMSVLSQDFPGLQELSLRYCAWQMVDARLVPAVANWPLLERIQFDNTCILDELICALASNCPRLQTVKMDSCHLVTDTGVAAMVKGCRQLHHIELSGAEVTVAALETIAAQCHRSRLTIRMLYSRITPTQAEPYLQFGEITHIDHSSRRQKRKKQ